MPVTDLSIDFTHPPTVVIYLLNKNKRCRRVVGHGSPGDSRQQMKSCRIIIDAIAISWPDLVFFCFVFTLLLLFYYDTTTKCRRVRVCSIGTSQRLRWNVRPPFKFFISHSNMRIGEIIRTRRGRGRGRGRGCGCVGWVAAGERVVGINRMVRRSAPFRPVHGGRAGIIITAGSVRHRIF